MLQNQQMGGAAAQKGKKQEAIRVCSCGDPNPDFRGYCKQCFTKLNEKFQYYLDRFRSVSEEYDQYTNQDTKAADEKLRLMKSKIEQYEIKLSDTEIVDVIDKHEKLAQSEENRAFAEFKASVEAMKQELAIAKARHAIELEDLRKQADYLEQTKMRKFAQQKDLDTQLSALRDENINLKNKLEDIDKRIILKKRYTIQHASRLRDIQSKPATESAK